MLALPEGSREEASAAEGEADARIAFGFDAAGRGAASGEEDEGVAPHAFFGDDARQQLGALASACAGVGGEVAALMKGLRGALQAASDATTANLVTFASMGSEVDQVVDVDVGDAEALVERTLALSQELEDVSEVESKVAALEKAMHRYERLADAILAKNRRRARR